MQNSDKIQRRLKYNSIGAVEDHDHHDAKERVVAAAADGVEQDQTQTQKGHAKMAYANLTPVLTRLTGKLGGFVFRHTKNGTVVANPPEVSTAPATIEQTLTRTYFSVATKQWKELTDGQRVDWQGYASAYFPKVKKGKKGPGPSGQAVYNKASWYRLAAGLSLPAAAPTEPRPVPASDAAVVAVSAQEEVSITVDHAITDVTGYRLFVEITPQMISPARQPQPAEFRSVNGIGAASLPVLQASGLTYNFTAIRYALPDGARFGVRLTVINPSGIPSLQFVKVVNQDIL